MTSLQRPCIRKKDIKKFERLYGNGVAYISDGGRLSELPDIASLYVTAGVNYWLTDGVAVGLGCFTIRLSRSRH